MAGLLAAALATAAAVVGVHQYDHVALSPSGDLVAAIEAVQVPHRAQEPHGALVVRKAADGAVVATYDPCADCTYADPAWSPDGRTLAVVGSDRRTHTAQLLTVAGGKASVAASFDGLLARPRWSPDGEVLAVLATAHPHKESGATNPGAARVGDIDQAPDERRIAVLDGPAVRLVSPADRFVYEYDWTPDGRGFVATDALGDGDNNWWIAKLEAVDLATGAARVIAAPKTQIGVPKVSPDGRTVAYIGGLMSDFPVFGGDLYTVPFAGGEPTDVTPGFKGSFNGLTWRRTGLFATALSVDRKTSFPVATLFQVAPGGALKTLWSDTAGIHADDGRLSLSADGTRAAAMSEDFSTAPRLVAGPLKALKAITHDNDALPAHGPVQSITWMSDGHLVQGWVLLPDAKALKGGLAGPHPMAVQIHGGPSSAVEPRFVWEGQVNALLDHGYFVFLPNPRGSYGQGEAFTRANIQDFGGGDLRDILAGVDAVEKALPIDDKRLAVLGGSYGGFMTMWTVTHSNRFKAGAASAGIANWISYYGQNGIDQWMVPFFGGTAYDNPAVYDRLSPIRSIKDVKTPTLIMVGELDVECPPAQSLEFWHGMKAMGVPTSLIIYPGEGHHLLKPVNQQDVEDRTIAWFDRYLGKPQ